MSSERAKQGLKIRREVLGPEYVDKAMQNVDDFNREFQDVLNDYCWGMVWGSENLARRERSILNLGMLAALGRMHEWELHFRGAMNNGLTREELKDVLTQIAVYCGIPAGVECFRIARRVLEETGA